MIRFTRPLALLAALALCACAAPPPDLLRIQRDFVIVRLHVDPSTQLGEFLAVLPEGGRIEEGLANLGCDGGISIIVHIDSGEDRALNVGIAQLLFASPDGVGDLCDGGTALIQPISYTDAEGTMGLVEGPLLIGGETLDGRLPIGRIDTIGGLDRNSFEVFPEWWEISGRARGLERVRDPDRAPGESDVILLNDARARAVWRVHQLATELLTDLDPMLPPEEETLLDSIIAAGIQPDVDMDADGLETFADTDGDGIVDRCIDGDGSTMVEGRECGTDPRFADGYDIRLIFRTVPVTIR